ncbi:hypothetical protein [Zhaonella formicivorans]|uniref:hypothetical protein n=1 Tax=Zhaonella formicivorans TaxID=2528593 RepID=UPI001D1118AF|nr:hypothetical protein [Zhaonella formicivorans]
MDKELYLILKPYDNWWNDEGEEKNLQAKKALNDFYKELKKYRVDRNYTKRDILHFSYFQYLVNIKRAFMQQQFMRACNEIVSLMHYGPFFQGRIYYNVLRVLEDLITLKIFLLINLNSMNSITWHIIFLM